MIGDGYSIYKTSKIIFNDPQYSDIKFVFEKEVVYAHWAVLLIECPKLWNLGNRNNNGFEVSVVMEDVDVSDFKEF